MTQVTYVAQDAPSFSITVKDPEKKVPNRRLEFSNKVLVLDDEADKEYIRLLDILIETRADIRHIVKKVERAAALLVAQHYKASRDSFPGAVKGSMTGFDLARAKLSQTHLDAAAKMRADGVPEEKIKSTLDSLDKDHQFTLATKGDPPQDTPSDGIRPNPEGQAAISGLGQAAKKVGIVKRG